MNATAPTLHFARRPAPVAYMLKALYPSPGLGQGGRFPAISARWTGHRFARAHRDGFAQLAGLGGGHVALPLLYPHVLGFPLLMAILTHPRFPLPIWNVLQIRNHMVQHAGLDDGVFDFEARVAGQRIVAKGAEVDLHTALTSHGRLAWESLNTFYFRGRFGAAGPASALARAPDAGKETVAEWNMPAGVGWRLAGLTGDYNGIHWWNGYARLFGFQRAFHHPQVVIGRCLAHLPAAGSARPQRLDVWLKGPVYYDSAVRLRAASESRASSFALHAADDRPAIIGRWSADAGSAALIDADDQPLPPPW